MQTPQKAAENACHEATLQIRSILNATHIDATPAEQLIRIGWVIGNLPADLRDAIVNEAQNRVVVGWAAGRKPTDW